VSLTRKPWPLDGVSQYLYKENGQTFYFDSKGFINPDSAEFCSTKSLPIEIVEIIVQEVLRSQSRAFSSIAAVSVVSRQLRDIALQAYFSTLIVHRVIVASRMNDIPNSCSWVR
jgi:hypothetical protein